MQVTACWAFGLLFEEMGLIIKYHGIVMKIKWASDLGRYIDRTINGTLKWSINLKENICEFNKVNIY